MQNFNIVVTFTCLWLAVYLPPVIEGYVACFFIFSVGLLHGANDIKIIKKVYEKYNLSFYKYLLLYILIVIIGTVMFYFIPLVNLMFFILISGYHFGEQHFHDIEYKNHFIKRILFFSYGCVVIFLLLFSNNIESTNVVNQITKVELYPNFFKYGLVTSLLVFGVCLAVIWRYIKNLHLELFYLLVFFIVFKTASLIWAFAIYFVLWHALPSLMDQIRYLSKTVNRVSILDYLKSSFVYWLISVLSLFIFFEFFISNNDLFYGFFFSFLAAITFPHVIVMTKIFKH